MYGVCMALCIGVGVRCYGVGVRCYGVCGYGVQALGVRVVYVVYVSCGVRCVYVVCIVL